MENVRTPLAERKLPVYTKGEEIFNMVTHIVGGAFGVVVLALCIIFAAIHNNIIGVMVGTIYAISMILCYVVSSIYHGIQPTTPKKIHAKKVMQVLDHCDIYFLIAGTYTPIAMTELRVMYPKTAWITFAIVWLVCIVGTIFTAIDFHRFAVLSYACYFIAGWSVFVAIPAIWNTYGPEFVGFLIGGGVVYTLGMIFFGLQKKYQYCHSVFHIFILGGSALQFVSIFVGCM